MTDNAIEKLEILRRWNRPAIASSLLYCWVESECINEDEFSYLIDEYFDKAEAAFPDDECTWINLRTKEPDVAGVYRCLMPDGSEKVLFFKIEAEWVEVSMKWVFWNHWFESQEDVDQWISMEYEDEPLLWMPVNELQEK